MLQIIFSHTRRPTLSKIFLLFYMGVWIVNEGLLTKKFCFSIIIYINESDISVHLQCVQCRGAIFFSETSIKRTFSGIRIVLRTTRILFLYPWLAYRLWWWLSWCFSRACTTFCFFHILGSGLSSDIVVSPTEIWSTRRWLLHWECRLIPSLHPLPSFSVLKVARH